MFNGHFPLENFNFKGNYSGINKDTGTVTIMIFSVASIKFDNEYYPHRKYSFQIIAFVNHFAQFLPYRSIVKSGTVIHAKALDY